MSSSPMSLRIDFLAPFFWSGHPGKPPVQMQCAKRDLVHSVFMLRPFSLQRFPMLAV